MFIAKCDVCKEEIKDYKNRIKVAAPGIFSEFAFCLNCGSPVLRFLKKNRFLAKDKEIRETI